MREYTFLYQEEVFLFNHRTLDIVSWPEGTSHPFIDDGSQRPRDLHYIASVGPDYLIVKIGFRRRSHKTVYLVPKCNPRLSKSRTLQLGGVRLIGSEHVLWWSRPPGAELGQTPDCGLLRVQDFVTQALDGGGFGGGIEIGNGFDREAKFVDIGDNRFLGEGVLMSVDRNYAFLKPPGWTGDLSEIEVKEVPGIRPLRSIANHTDCKTIHPPYWPPYHKETVAPFEEAGMVRVAVLEGGRLEVRGGAPLMDVSYIGRLKNRGGGYYTILSGRFSEGKEKSMWAYDYINGTLADLDVPIGKWVACTESTMKRLEGTETIDVDRFPEFKNYDEHMSPEERADTSFSTYASECTDEAMLNSLLHRTSPSHVARDPLSIASTMHCTDSRLSKFWRFTDSGQGTDIGRFRVIAGMGPVPMRLRSKKYKEIKIGDFADYLGGPIFYNSDRDYPTQFVEVATLLEFDYFRRSTNSMHLLNCYSPGHPHQLSVGDELFEPPIWVGVVDIEMEEEPLKYLSMEEASSYDPPKTPDGRPYFEVTSGTLMGGDACNPTLPDYPVVGNVANGKWFFKSVENGAGMPQLIVWHESVDNEPEFQAPSELTQKDYEGVRSLPHRYPYHAQKKRREQFMLFVNRFLEGTEVPMDVGEHIADYFVEHHDSTYWKNNTHPDGWIQHRTPLYDRMEVIGFFDPNLDTTANASRFGFLHVPEESLIRVDTHAYHVETPWKGLIDECKRHWGTVHGLPGGCVLNSLGSCFPLEFKFGKNQIHAARIVMGFVI